MVALSRRKTRLAQTHHAWECRPHSHRSLAPFQRPDRHPGAVYRAEAPVSLAINVARGFRAPSASDLFANGFHEGTRAFEIGRADLRVESSLNTDLGLRLRSSRASGELTGYVNSIRDYIYLAPVGIPGMALDSLRVEQGHARLHGAEAAFAISLGLNLTAQVNADLVHAVNTSDGSALPFIPPFRRPRRFAGTRGLPDPACRSRPNGMRDRRERFALIMRRQPGLRYTRRPALVE